MKVLLLVDINERNLFHSEKIEKELNKVGIETFSLVGYCDYLQQVNLAANFEHAYFKTIAAKLDSVMNTDKNLLVIGNCQKDLYKFDEVYAWTEDLHEKYQDTTKELIKKKWIQSEDLLKVLDGTYNIEDCLDTLHTVDGVIVFMKELLK